MMKDKAEFLKREFVGISVYFFFVLFPYTAIFLLTIRQSSVIQYCPCFIVVIVCVIVFLVLF